MIRTLPRTMIATALSAALLFTPATVTPAQADEDVAKVIGGIAALVILNKVINDRQDRREAANRQATNRQIYRPHRSQRRQQRHLKVAPQNCLREQWTHRGYRQVYGARCMRNNAQVALPRDCLRRARTNDGPRRFYTKRCLRQNGWRA